MRLLLTRPERDAERTAAVLRSRGHLVSVAPLLRILTLPDVELGGGPWAAILVTSANAAPAIAAHKRLRELLTVPVFAVGERSAQGMRSAGFADVSSADGDVGDLVRLVGERLRPGLPLLYLAGADRAGDVAAALAVRNFVVRTVVIYRAVAVENLPRAAAAGFAGGIDGVLHFSRRSAEAFVDATRQAGLGDKALRGPMHFCLSAQVGEPLAAAGATRIAIAPCPTEAALLGLIPAA